MADINIYGKFHAATSEHKLASTSEIYDDSKQKFQSEINAEADAKITQLTANEGELKNLDTVAKDNLVNAINEARLSGGGSGSSTSIIYNSDEDMLKITSTDSYFRYDEDNNTLYMR